MPLNRPTSFSYLFKSVDPSSLALFRALLGSLFFFNFLIYYPPEIIKIRYVAVQFFFSFPLFDILNLKLLHGAQWYQLILALSVLSLLIAMGFLYRLAIITYFFLYGYLFLVDKSYVQPEHYLYLLIVFLLMFMSPHKTLSVDAVLFGKKKEEGIPYWNLFILKAQIIIMFFYSGMAKLFHSDWIEGRQLGIWLNAVKDTPIIGSLFANRLTAAFFSYGGIVFDLSIGFLLLNKKTRAAAIFLSLFFHLFNKYLSDINIFPWFMLATLILFIEPAEARQTLNDLKKFFKLKTSSFQEASIKRISHTQEKITVFFIFIYLFVQVIVPLRSFLYPCNVNWTYLGEDFSWHMMNNNMWATLKINYTNPKNDIHFNAAPISRWQTEWLALHPDMMIQYAHYLRDELKKRGVEHPVITFDIEKSLNGRTPCPFIDKNVNLAEETLKPFQCPSWILPHPNLQNCR